MNAIIVEPPQSATASVIWLHGLGANGHDFEPIVSELPQNLTCHTRFIFPHAPQRSIAINGGMIMRGWYDVAHLDLTFQQDIQGIYESEHILKTYLSKEIEAGILSQQIVLAGFSQGGAIALHTGLRYTSPLAGIMALSTYLPLSDQVETEIHPTNRNISIFMGHGEFDQVIPLNQAQSSRNRLEQLGYVIQWHTYRMEHHVNYQEIQDIGDWLSQRLN